jgi:hypothetical protein
MHDEPLGLGETPIIATEHEHFVVGCGVDKMAIPVAREYPDELVIAVDRGTECVRDAPGLHFGFRAHILDCHLTVSLY